MPQIDLDQITVASPCTADWDAMQGDEVKRFCSQCELNVYNLSGMERGEAETFVREAEGDVCVRMYKRRDGTLITQDCPVGLRAVLRRRLSWLAGLAASLLATVGGVFAGARSAEDTRTVGARPLPLAVMSDPGSENPADPPELDDELLMVMGEMIAPEPEAEVCDELETVMGQVIAPEIELEESTPEPEEPRKIMGKMRR